MAATLLPNAKQTFLDGNGKPLAGGKVFFYIPNTSTFKSTWQDPAQTILNTNPVILDASGEAIIWGAGTYRQVVYDVLGNLIWDQITEDTSAGIIGNFTDDLFIVGDGTGGTFIPGTTTVLTLTSDPGTLANSWIYFDGVYQADNQIQSLAFPTLTFTEPIPVGTELVTVKSGSSISIGVPADGSVTTPKIANGAVTDAKLATTSVAYVITQNTWTLKRFGAKGDGVTDDTARIIDAFTSGEPYIEGDAATFAISGALPIAANGFAFRGKGQYQTILQSHDASAAGITIANGLTGVKIGGFQIAKALGQVVAGDAVAFLGTSENCELDDIQALGFFKGFVLGTTDLGFVSRCTASKNWGYGFDMSNTAAAMYGPTQWQLDTIFSAQNNIHGFFLHSNTGVPGMVLGAWRNVQTYANNGYGLILSGSDATPIFDLRLDQFFFGNDSQGSVYIDSHGYNNRVENGMIEESARGLSGPTLSVTSPGLGNGLHVGPSERDFSIANTTLTNSALNGIEMYGGSVNITNVNVNNSGLNTGVAGSVGVAVNAGHAIINGGRIVANPIGVAVVSGDAIICGTDLRDNTTSPTSGITTASKVSGCLPLAANN